MVIKSFFNQSSFIERNCSHFGKCITVSILMASQQHALSNEARTLSKFKRKNGFSIRSVLGEQSGLAFDFFGEKKSQNENVKNIYKLNI